MKKYKVGGLFSGVGGIELGFENQDFKISWANEIDKYCAETYRANFSHNLIHEDIYKITKDKKFSLTPVDILCAGFPCQAFSVAGYRKGLKDKRGILFYQILEVINRLKTKPKVLLLENVKNFSTHDKGRTLKILKEELGKLGYCVFHDVLNTADYTDIPQNRERTFIICFLGGPNNPMVSKFKALFSPKKNNRKKKFREMLGKNVNEKYYYREDKYMYADLCDAMTSMDTFYQYRRIYVRENKKGLCPTLTANMGTGGHNVPLILTKLKPEKEIRKLTPKECFLLQGFPKSFKLPDNVPNTQLYKQAGNSVTVKMIEILAKIIKKCLDKN